MAIAVNKKDSVLYTYLTKNPPLSSFGAVSLILVNHPVTLSWKARISPWWKLNTWLQTKKKRLDSSSLF